MAKRRYNITAIIRDKRGRILSVGKNQYKKSHPLMASISKMAGEPYKIALHAEVDAIIKCHDISKAASISVYRYDAQGNPKLAKPCLSCERAIKMFNIKNVEWTIDVV